MNTDTMTCLCGTLHTFAEGVSSLRCDCGFDLWYVEERDTVRDEAMEADVDEEPGDLDSDEGYNPYTGGADDDGYDTGCFDDGPGFFDE